jgi:hypothetical protein
VVPQDAALPARPVEPQHVDGRVQPPLVVGRGGGVVGVGLPLGGGSVEVPARSSGRADGQLGRRQVLLRQPDGVDDPLLDGGHVVARDRAPLAEELERRHRVGVRGADPDVVRGDARHLLHPPAHAGRHLRRDDRDVHGHDRRDRVTHAQHERPRRRRLADPRDQPARLPLGDVKPRQLDLQWRRGVHDSLARLELPGGSPPSGVRPIRGGSGAGRQRAVEELSTPETSGVAVSHV